jgi:5-methylcytosine-specific restriction endonuclease McrA
VTARRQPDSVCSGCRQKKPRTREFYYADKRASDGLHSACKDCHLKRTAAHEKRHPRNRIEYAREWRNKNREHLRARHKVESAKWRKANRAKRMQWEAAYRRTERYRKKNVAYQATRRARKAGAIGSHTAQEFADQLAKQKYRCFYCGKNIRHKATEDHFIPLSRGGHNYIDNIRAACLSCNISKGNKLLIAAE